MKCELIASLLHSPELLFLDEPTLGLDVVSQQRLRDFLEEYHKRKKATVILTSHNMEDIKNLCKRVIMIDKGKILYDGRLSELTEKFVKEKFVHFVLPEVHQEKEISGLGKVLEFNGTTGLMLVDRGKIKEVTKVLIDKFDVEDIDIEEPTLESVVRIYGVIFGILIIREMSEWSKETVLKTVAVFCTWVRIPLSPPVLIGLVLYIVATIRLVNYGNKNLANKESQNDEFYTQYPDIQKEIEAYL